MSYTYTVSETFTRTHAKYLATKVAADLRQLRRFYGKPSDKEILDYIEELIILLTEDCLASVEYGFRQGNNWVVAVRYVVRSGMLISSDDRPGRAPVGGDTSVATWYSYLRYNNRWSDITEDEQQRIREMLPFQRTSAPEPGIGNGYWVDEKTYSRAGVALDRGSFKSS